MKSVVELVDVMKVSDEESILLTGLKVTSRLQKKFLLWDQSWLPLHWGEHGVLMATKAEKKSSKHFRHMRSIQPRRRILSGGGVLCSILSINKW